MNKAQPRYLMKALATCKTHSPGTTLVYTGPRSQKPNGWIIISKLKE